MPCHATEATVTKLKKEENRNNKNVESPGNSKTVLMAQLFGFVGNFGEQLFISCQNN